MSLGLGVSPCDSVNVRVPSSVSLTCLLLRAGATVLSAAALSAMPTGLPLEAPESYPQLPQWPPGAAEGVLPIVPPAVQPGTWPTSAGQSDAVAVRLICLVQPCCSTAALGMCICSVIVIVHRISSKGQHDRQPEHAYARQHS